MSSNLNHGRRLTHREYERAVVDLYTQDGASNIDQSELRRRELNLTIDYRLGVDFPVSRREELWIIQQEIESKRLRLLAKSIIVRFLPFLARHRSNSIAGFVLKKYEQVLSPEEMKVFFQ